MSDSSSNDAFWNFTLAYYGRPGVSAALIELQDEHGYDVNLALWCLWVGASGRGRLDSDAIARADAAAGPWRSEVIVPLRGARRALKGSPIAGAEALRTRVKDAELEAERLQHGNLASLAPPERPMTDRQADAAANLRTYLRRDLPQAAVLLGALQER
jgi:uncharacterized protein (TIGR02444 family)